MMKVLVLSIIAFINFTLFAQSFFPEEGQQLNFTSILFKTEPVYNANSYEFVIDQVNGNFQNPLLKLNSPCSQIRIDGLKFGTGYIWKVIVKDKLGNPLSESGKRFFTIGRILSVIESNYRYNINQSDLSEQSNDLLFLDYNGVAITRKGEPVWFLPPNAGGRNARVRDVKMTNNGTITYVTARKAFEIDLSGNILWSTPDETIIETDTIRNFHHEFTKLENGNYLVLAKYFRPNDVLSEVKSNTIPYTIVIEYDAEGKVVWYWNSLDFITRKDIEEIRMDGLNGDTYGHANSIKLSPDKKFIYVSFRNLNVIVKIDRQQRKVISSFGEKIPTDQVNQPCHFFQRQHSAVSLPDDQVLLFNNSDSLESSVIIFKETTHNDTIKKTWEFVCDIDSLTSSYSDRMGNVIPLETGNILVNMGLVNRIFEVTRGKQIVWDCLPEKWSSDSSVWVPFPNYRCSQTSTLYPFEFCIESHENETGNRSFTIYNVGSETDSYLISNQWNKIIKKRIEIEAGKSITFMLSDIFSKKELKKGLNLEVHSSRSSKTIKQFFPK